MNVIFVGGEQNGMGCTLVEFTDLIYMPDGEYVRSKFKNSNGVELYIHESLAWFKYEP